MRILGFLFLLFCGFGATAQKILVFESEEKIDDKKRSGLFTVVDLDDELVKRQWQKKLRSLGSLKTKSGIILVDNANLKGVSASPLKIVSKVLKEEKGSKIWYSIETGDNQYITSKDNSAFAEASKFLHDFGVELYIQDINAQIKEAEQVLSGVVKDHEKILFAGNEIKTSIYKNKEERALLIQKLAIADTTYKSLKIDSIQNNEKLRLSNENVDKMKKAVDLIKTKITKLE